MFLFQHSVFLLFAPKARRKKTSATTKYWCWLQLTGVRQIEMATTIVRNKQINWLGQGDIEMRFVPGSWGNLDELKTAEKKTTLETKTEINKCFALRLRSCAGIIMGCQPNTTTQLLAAICAAQLVYLLPIVMCLRGDAIFILAVAYECRRSASSLSFRCFSSNFFFCFHRFAANWMSEWLSFDFVSVSNWLQLLWVRDRFDG